MEHPDTTRRCGYSHCGAELSYDGRGRPPEYCPDRRWPDGRSCRQLAAVERDAARATGLETPLEEFRALADRFTAPAEGLARQLEGLLSAVREVADGSLSRMAAAEQAMGEAIRRAEAALTETETARRALREADAQRERALAQAREAEARGTAARADAEDQIRRAWAQASQADQGRGQAEARAVAAETARAEETGRREVADRRATAVESRLAATREELTTIGGRLEAERLEVRLLTERADRGAVDLTERIGRIETLETESRATRLELEEAWSRAGAADSRWRQLLAEREADRAITATLRREVDHARSAASSATATAKAVLQRAESAESRLDALLARLPGRD
jgi:hypothetical protein